MGPVVLTTLYHAHRDAVESQAVCALRPQREFQSAAGKGAHPPHRHDDVPPLRGNRRMDLGRRVAVGRRPPGLPDRRQGIRRCRLAPAVTPCYTDGMNIRTIPAGDLTIAEIVSEDVLMRTPQDALDIIGNVHSDYIVLHEHNFETGFYDLSTRKLGEILLKFGNYRVRLAIVGDFDKYPSKALKAFIYETNRHGEFLFVSSIDEATRLWQRAAGA